MPGTRLKPQLAYTGSQWCCLHNFRLQSCVRKRTTV